MRFAVAPVVLALVTGALSGACSSPVMLAATDAQRVPVSRDGGLEITVPALWADSGAGTSGIEPARIWASRSGAAAFQIELTDLKARGAGAQWVAASSSAAAVGSMSSGLNPGRIDVGFTITGPIDGPSAGGILTVGVLAALLNSPIRGDVTMTGTISPDGSIGAIGGVDLKLRAAAEQGYRVVLLPIPNMLVRDVASGQVRSAADVGKELGLEVIPVANVQQAYTIFTDGKFSYPSAPAVSLPEAVNALVTAQTTDLLAAATSGLADVPAGSAQDAASSLLAQGRQAAGSGNMALAYGLGMLGMNIVGRERAAAGIQALIAAQGLTAARTRMAADIAAAKARNAAALSQAVVDTGALGYEQQIAMPNALSWLAYNQAILASLGDAIDASGSPTQEDLDRGARILADVNLAIDIYFPNQAAVVRASPAKPSPGESVVATYLSEYTEFLVRAGRANEKYARVVVLRGQDPKVLEQQNDVGLLLPVTGYLGTAVDTIPASTQSIPEELIQATTAVTYYIATASLIASVQDFGIDQFGIGADPSDVGQAEVLASSVRFSKQAVDQVSALLGQRGLDASLPVWSSDYGSSTATAMAKTPQAGAAAVLALNELYFDVVTVFMLQAGPVQ